MENRRFILIALLGVVLFFMYQAWQKDYPDLPPAPPAATPSPSAPDDDVPARGAADPDVPAPAAPAASPMPAAPAAPNVAGTDRRIRVETDLVVAEIALAGGDLRRLELKGYPVSKDRPDQNLPLLDDHAPRYFVLHSGLAGTTVATHKAPFTASQERYRLVEGADSVDVTLEAAGADGLRVQKIYRFKRGTHQLDLIHRVDNAGSAPRTVSPYARFVRTDFKTGDEPPFVQTFTGTGLYQQKAPGGSSYRFVKTALGDLADEPFEVKQQGGWIAMMQHYFLAAILPPPNAPNEFSAKPAQMPPGAFLAQYLGEGVTVPAGGSHVFTTPLYVGPKLQRSIGSHAEGLHKTVDYGILEGIADPLFWILDWFYKLTKNWGAAIILLTLLVKAAMYKLSEAQYRSMAKMKRFAPKIQDIKERYGEDRERMQKAMMELYKKEGFNPLAGCWPLLLQFPVFIALYWVLLESVELRQAPFALWINDLSASDPYFVLPILFGISMFVQQKLSGQQMPDPMQQKIMNVMPIMLTAFFAFFQSGLVLYWLVSNLIGIGQQWYITRKLEKEGFAKR